MAEDHEKQGKRRVAQLTTASKDLIIIGACVLFVFILSYDFNLLRFLVDLFQRDPNAASSVDEIIIVLLTFSIGFAIFSWRRWDELKKETDRRLKLQEELLRNAETKAETEKIICKQLRREIEERKRITRKYFSI
jgi:uncharacterized membrane protein YcjF (UPF0283 family)